MSFLRWALPRLDMRWPGFRKVRRQVCRRVAARVRDLGLADVAAYRALLESDATEWQFLDGACRITISRFYRDRGVFEALATTVLPALVRAATARGDRELRGLSVGCGSGEEPYSLTLLWELALGPARGPLGLRICAIDTDPGLIARAERGCYPAGSLAELPEPWRLSAFERADGESCLRSRYRRAVRFALGDARRALPAGPFDLVLCRNLVFTYYVESRQREFLARIHARMHDGAALVVGIHESIPAHRAGFQPWAGVRCTFRRDPSGSADFAPLSTRPSLSHR